MSGLPKVLIVDDDPAQLVELADFVSKLGYQCLAADNGREGVSLACEDPQIGIILIDMNLPDGHGLDVLSAIRDYVDPRRGTQYLLITGRPDIEEAIEGFDRGALTLLVKPLDPALLRKELEAATARLRAEGGAPARATGGFRHRLQKIMELRARLGSETEPSPGRLMAAVREVSALGEALGDGALSFKALNLLSEIARAEEACEKLSVITLCLTANMPQTTGLRYLQELIEAGLVEKHPDPHDGRRQFVTLSSAGRERLRRAAAARRAARLSGASTA
jgi:DNA-binding response OmpR family regulator/predicted transcriptional regulator